MSLDLAKAKKMAPFGFVVFVALVAAGVWVFVSDALPSLADVYARAPSVRIRSAAFAGPLGALVFLSGASLAVARFFYASRLARFSEMAFLWIGLISIPLMLVVIVGGSFLQRHYMPQLGYHYCNKLSGNPTVWFNDWVRDPAWCVYKKDHAWVREQAAAKGAAK